MQYALPIRPIILLGLLLGVFSTLRAQKLPVLQAAVDALDQHPDMRPAQWGIAVRDAKTGTLLLAHHGNRNLATASTMKAVTTSAALEVLGADHHFETHLEFSGELKEGVLTGDLYIRGSGDPTLGSHRFGEAFTLNKLLEDWMKAVKAKGITRINGRIIGDDRYFSTQLNPGEWPWEDMGNYYGIGASGLSIHENFYRLDFSSGAPGRAVSIQRTEPLQDDLTFVNEVKAGPAGSGDNAYIFGVPHTAVRYVRGTIPPNRKLFSIKGSMNNPAYTAARLLTEELTNCGITITEPPLSGHGATQAGLALSSTGTRIHTHRSPSLRMIVEETNMESINLYAEALAVHVAKALKKPFRAGEAAEAVAGYWRSRGVDVGGMYVRDGSGLSPNNVMSPNQMTAILAAARTGKAYPAFEASLPLAGRSGSLKRMLKGTAAEGRLRAKSGYISGVRAYTGYVRTSDGRELCFAMMANHHAGSSGGMRRHLEGLMAKIADGR